MTLNLGPDSITKVYRHVPVGILEAIKAAPRDKRISIKTLPMPGKRDSYQMTVKFAAHSWYASSQLSADWYASLPAETRESLSCYLESTR